jgi:hypothetical protein
MGRYGHLTSDEVDIGAVDDKKVSAAKIEMSRPVWLANDYSGAPMKNDWWSGIARLGCTSNNSDEYENYEWWLGSWRGLISWMGVRKGNDWRRPEGNIYKQRMRDEGIRFSRMMLQMQMLMLMLMPKPTGRRRRRRRIMMTSNGPDWYEH